MKGNCSNCGHAGLDKGRAFDRRRAYRCQKCGHMWHAWQGSIKRYSHMRIFTQFANSGAARINGDPARAKRLRG